MPTEPQQDGIDPTLPAPTEPAAAPLSTSGAGRRRFVKAGVGVGGVIATLASESALGTVCVAPSASLSVTFASHNKKVYKCGGLSPGYYMNHSWPAGVSQSTKFGTLFSCTTGSLYAYYAKATLGQLINKTASFPSGQKDWYEIGRHFVAQYLNIVSGRIDFMTVAQLQAMWKEYMMHGGNLGGYYQVNATTRWDGTQIVNYLKSTMT